MVTNKVKGLLPKVLVLYFLAQYIILVISFQYQINLEPLNVLVFSLTFLYVMLKMEVRKNIFFTLLIYTSFLVSTLSFATLFADEPAYSLVRVLISSWLLFAMIITFFYVFKQSRENYNWNNAISKSLLVILVIAPIGQLLIPEWTYGMRLSGGLNPNGMGYIALFCNFWFFYQKISGDKSRKTNIAWVLSMVLVIWAMSRTVFLMAGILYGGYLFFMILSGIYKLTIKRILAFPVIIGLVVVIFGNIKDTIWYQVNIARLFDTANVVSRGSAWNVALERFNENVLVGGVGWWNLSKLLDHSSALTDSPHNSYIRILSETGLIGLLAVMILPIFLLFWLILSSFAKGTINRKQRFLVISMMLGSLVSLGFEDRYLTGFGGFNTGVIVWVMVMGLVILTEQPQKSTQNIFSNTNQKFRKKRKRYRLTW